MHNQNHIPHNHSNHSKLLIYENAKSNMLCYPSKKIHGSPPAGQSVISTRQDTQGLCHTPRRTSSKRIPQAVASMAAEIGVEYLGEAMTDISAEYI